MATACNTSDLCVMQKTDLVEPDLDDHGVRQCVRESNLCRNIHR